ncbi:MAG: hypothetical protein IPG43_23465 [Proteobacteria bacterium]|nr:hypothetical protein [Pseudomonadota bacterium]
MAVIERGKARTSTPSRSRAADRLRMREVQHGDERLPGYRRLPTVEAAQAVLDASVREWLAEGMKPADDEARAIAALATPAEAAPTSFPIPCDLGIYNEATGLVVTSRRMAGKATTSSSSVMSPFPRAATVPPCTPTCTVSMAAA